MADLFNELKQRTWESRTADSPIGLEHAIVSRADGTRWLLRGGQEGIDFSQFDDYRRLLVHTHGRPTGPSFDADIPFLKANKQKHSYIVELGNPNAIRFNQDGSYFEFKVR